MIAMGLICEPEILIADDCSTDLTTGIDRIITGLNTIHNRQNLRFLRNCNAAAKLAKAQQLGIPILTESEFLQMLAAEK